MSKSVFHTTKPWGLENQKLHLNRQDRLIICSPGLLKNPAPYPLTRLKQLLKEQASAEIHQLRNAVMYDTKKFFQSIQRDQSLVIIETQKKALTLTPLKKKPITKKTMK